MSKKIVYMEIDRIAHEWACNNKDKSLEEAFSAGFSYNHKIAGLKNIDERKEKFKAEVLLYQGQYPDYMLIEFYEYWSECGGRKMRFEKEKTFEVSKRLARWSNNSFRNNGNRNYTNKQGNSGSIFQAADSYLQEHQ